MDISTAAPFPSYRGGLPFIFISYAHRNSAIVFEHLKRLNQMGYRMWYDEGIDPGKEWPEEIAAAINRCSCFVAFISGEAVLSDNVRKEINFALTKKKHIICVYIEETKLPLGLEMQLSTIQAIMQHRIQSKEKFYAFLAQAVPAETKESNADSFIVASRDEKEAKEPGNRVFRSWQWIAGASGILLVPAVALVLIIMNHNAEKNIGGLDNNGSVNANEGIEATETPALPASGNEDAGMLSAAIKFEGEYETVALFSEDFESYPLDSVLTEIPESPWTRLEEGRNGSVSGYWVHSGQKNLRINSFMENNETDYVLLDMDEKPSQLNVELWYTPDGYYVYTVFAEFGLGLVSSKFDMEKMAGFWGSAHDVLFEPFKPGAESETVNVFNELEFARGPADMDVGTPKHNYIRAEFDFDNNDVRFFIGQDEDAPLRCTALFDGSQDFNAFYISGGVNETYIDDIYIEGVFKR